MLTPHYCVINFAEPDLSDLQNQINKLRTALDQLCGINQTSITAQPPPSWHSPYNWTSVPKTHIGSSDLRDAATFSYPIPDSIPSSALEVLVYAGLHSGSTNEVSNDFKIYTQIGDKRYEKYLYLESWEQNAINTNSDNMWFPMPPNRLVYLTVSVGLGDNAGVYLYTIGYR